MAVGRRGFLGLAGGGAAAALWPVASGRGAAAAGPVAAGVMVLIDGIGPATPPAALRGALVPLLEAAVPVTLGLGPAGTGGYPEPLAVLLRAALSDFAGLVEPAPRVPGLAALSPYFQLRAAAEAVAALERDLAEPGRPALALAPLASLVTDHAPAPGGHDALRALGLRNLLVPSAAEAAPRSLACDGDAMCHLGSLRPDLAAPDMALAGLRAPTAAGSGATLLAIDAAALAAAGTEAEVRAAVGRLRDRIVAAVAAGSIFLTAPRLQLAWLPPAFGRRIGLRLVPPAPGDTGAEAGYAILRASLTAAGFGLSDSLSPAAPDGDGAGTAATVLALGSGDPSPVLAVAGRAARGGQVVAAGSATDPVAAALAEAGLTVLTGPTAPGRPAFDGMGLLRRDEAGDPAALAAAPAWQDLFLALGPDHYRDAAARSRVLDALSATVADGRSRIVATAALASDLLPADPVFAILRDSRRDPGTEGAPPAPEDAEARSALLDDARHAWAHLEATTVPATGLSLATLHLIGTTRYSYRSLTMWDLGSLILATLAATELGLLPQVAGLARVDRLLAAVPTGRALPPETLSADTGRPQSVDFNACDTGRLLAALRAVDLTPGLRGRGAEIVARWDLSGAVAEGRLLSVVGGRAVDATRSPCAHYAARAFAAWGLAASSPLDLPADGSVTDHRMRVLEAAAARGPYGAEPLLLDPIELGPSDAGEVLTEVLFAAQARATRETGLPFCLSEGPLDREPWFGYDGLRLDDSAQRWVSRALGEGPTRTTAGAVPPTLRFSTKAAYLWAAARPGPLADRFLAEARRTGRQETGGFSPGFYLATGTGMPGYTDVNTNAILVEAVAHILRGRRPIGMPPPPLPQTPSAPAAGPGPVRLPPAAAPAVP